MIIMILSLVMMIKLDSNIIIDIIIIIIYILSHYIIRLIIILFNSFFIYLFIFCLSSNKRKKSYDFAHDSFRLTVFSIKIKYIEFFLFCLNILQWISCHDNTKKWVFDSLYTIIKYIWIWIIENFTPTSIGLSFLFLLSISDLDQRSQQF